MNKISKNIFRAYDIRGITENINQKPAEFSKNDAYLIGKASGKYLSENYKVKTMAVGQDVRLTGKEYKDLFIKGVSESKIKVTDIGFATSPLVYWSVCAKDFDAGANITASHNPKEYNGIKLVTKNAHSICGEELQKIYQMIVNEELPANSEAETSEAIETTNIWEDYLTDLSSKVSLQRPLKVVVDAGNGVAGPFIVRLLKKLNLEVVELYTTPDGTFPNHEANPEELTNMLDLIDTVKKTGADIGMGFDGDGDRIGIVDEKGKLYTSDYILLLLAKDLATRVENPKVIFDVKVSQVVISELKKIGAIPIMSKTGHSFIEQKMKEENGHLAGEVSGHLFFSENYFGFDDAFLAAIKILEILSKDSVPLSAHFSRLPVSYATPEIKISCPDEKKFAIVKELTKIFTSRYECITIDGVRVLFDENSWGAVRASNTSPNLTLRFESTTKEKLEEIINIMKIELLNYPETDLKNLDIIDLP